MPLFDVEVRTTSLVYYVVEAETEEEAREHWSLGEENGEFVESEEVVDVRPYDDRFDDDDDDDDLYDDEEFDFEEGEYLNA